MKKPILGMLAIGLAALALSNGAAAETYPSKPINIIAPFTPGSATDVWARAIGAQLSKRLNQSVIVDNRVGASGQIGAAYVAKAPADGYTLLLATPPNAIHMTLYPKLPYDFKRDFEPVIHLAKFPLVLVAGPQSKANTLQELLAEGRANPGKLTFGSAGTGSSTHLAGELLASLAKISMTHIPYKGTSAVYTDLIGGNITMSFDTVTGAMAQVNSGNVRALVLAATKRSPALPNVPTSVEQKLPEFQASSWAAIFVRSGTPAPIVARLNTEIDAILKEKTFSEPFESQGAEIIGGPPQELGRFFDDEVSRWRQVITSANVKVE